MVAVKYQINNQIIGGKMKINFRILNREFGIQILSRKIMKDQIEGYTSKCLDGKHIICIDYDQIELPWLISELTTLQEAFCLGNFYIFESSKDNYHAVCTDKLTTKDYVTIMANTSVCSNYLFIPFRYGKKLWTLRFSEKRGSCPSYILTLNSEHEGEKQKSLAHTRLLNKILPFQIPETNCDISTKIIKAKYLI